MITHHFIIHIYLNGTNTKRHQQLSLIVYSCPRNNRTIAKKKSDKEWYTMPARNKLIVPGALEAVNMLKMEIANELGIDLSGNTTSRGNGSVGGEITKRLIAQAQKGMDNPLQK